MPVPLPPGCSSNPIAPANTTFGNCAGHNKAGDDCVGSCAAGFVGTANATCNTDTPPAWEYSVECERGEPQATLKAVGGGLPDTGCSCWWRHCRLAAAPPRLRPLAPEHLAAANRESGLSALQGGQREGGSGPEQLRCYLQVEVLTHCMPDVLQPQKTQQSHALPCQMTSTPATAQLSVLFALATAPMELLTATQSRWNAVPTETG